MFLSNKTEEKMAQFRALKSTTELFVKEKYNILHQWVHYETPAKILQEHTIDKTYFIQRYASGVFDYFIGVISGEREIGNCPVMQEFLAYLKTREISADELFELCSHFRRSMIDFSYDAQINSKELFDEISYLFDKNFRGILKFYTDTIFQKLIDARQEAVLASQAKEYFLSNMSHEIRTPLNAILGFVNILLEDELSKKHRGYLEIILNSGENLLSIINDILDFSKLRSGEFTIEKKVFSVHEEISHTLELFVASARIKNIVITSFIDPKIPLKLKADILRIKQIVSNFISNAIKFTPAGGHIHVEVNCLNEVLNISVRDNGIGINEEDRKNIFQAFAQAQYAKESRSDGTGLGLSISYQLAELMGGMVGVKSQPEKGSTFWVEIPVEVVERKYLEFSELKTLEQMRIVVFAHDYNLDYRHKSFLRYTDEFEVGVSVVNHLESDYDLCVFLYEDLNSEDISKIIKNTEKKYLAITSNECDIFDNYLHVSSVSFPLYCTKLRGAFGELLSPQEFVEHKKQITKHYRGKILVAEDNEANQELIKIILSKFGLEFDMVGNGMEAVDAFQKHHYDLILMDEQMPQMDGTEAVKLIRKYEEQTGQERTVISALTANVLKGAKEEGLLNGYDYFLGKPVVISELAELFEKYLEPDFQYEAKEEKEVADEKGQIVGLDVEKLTKELMLTPEELKMLLELFIKKMSQVLPELQEAIQNKDFKTIAIKAHNIKGSSGNFRIEFIQKLASEMEHMAKISNDAYPYVQNFEKIKAAIESIQVT